MSEPSDGTCGPVRVTAWVRGRVQGVGFRWWVRCHALSLGLAGSAANRPDGRVEIVAEGSREACGRLLVLLDPDAGAGAAPAPAPGGHDTDWGIPGGGVARGRPGHVTGTSHLWSDARGREGFEVR